MTQDDVQQNMENRINAMNPPNAEVMRKLQSEVERSKEEERNFRQYHFLDACEDINFWDFRSKNPKTIMELELEMDLSDWDDLAGKLKLDYRLIQRWQKYSTPFPCKEALDTLEKGKQHEDLSLRTVLEVLVDLQRHDILRKINWEKHIDQFKDKTTESSVTLSEDCNLSVSETEKCSPKSCTVSIQQRQEVLSMASNQGHIKTEGRTSRFEARVLMIHAQDARDDALKLAKQLRDQPSERRKIGVMLLQESEVEIVINSLASDAFNSIYKWFKLVDAVVPVLSPKFLRQIQNRDTDRTSVNETRYNRNVYRLILDNFAVQGSWNYFCRAVCPASYYNQISQHAMVEGNPLFHPLWPCSSEGEVEKFADILITTRKAWAKKRKTRKQREMEGVAN